VHFGLKKNYLTVIQWIWRASGNTTSKGFSGGGTLGQRYKPCIMRMLSFISTCKLYMSH